MFSLSSAYAADIVEDWTTKPVWTPTAAPTSNGATTNNKQATSPTGITYTFTRVAKNAGTAAVNGFLSYGNNQNAVLKFKLPINCSEIKMVPSADGGSVKLSANGNAIETTETLVADKEVSFTIPEEYRAADTEYAIARVSSSPKFSKFTYVEAVEEGPSALTVPYDITFDEADKVEGWTAECESERAIFAYTPANISPVYSGLPGVASKNLFSSNPTQTKDSWFISPAFKLKAGKKYIVKYKIGITSGVLAQIGISYGTEATGAAMTETALAVDQEYGKGLAADQFYTISGTVAPTADGLYYIGFYDNTDKNNSAKTVINAVSVTEAASGQMPGEPTDFTAVPSADGALSVDLSAKAPTLDAEGNAITALTKLEFLNGTTVVKTFDNPTPGELYTYTDKTNVKHGNNTYGVRAVNSFGNSNVVEASFEAGLPTPNELTNVSAIQTEVGSVKFSWTKPEYSFGNKILFTNPDLITVKIVAYEGDTEFKTFDGLTGDEAVIDILPSTTTEQKFFNFKVFAVTSGGPSINGVDVNGIAVGKPAELPYFENFEGGQPSNPMYISNNEKFTASWGYASIGEDSTPVARFLSTSGYGATATLYSGLIEIPEASENQMTFKYSNGGSSLSTNHTLTVLINGEEAKQYTCDTSEFTEGLIDLAPYAGSTIQYAFRAKLGTVAYYVAVTDILIDKKSGIADIVADEDAPVEYFNLQGIRVENPAAGIYIRRQGNKVTKVLVK